jgi:hypothetical protein
VRPPATRATSDPHPGAEATSRRSGSPATAARPVFLDPSGRRQRRVRRFGRLLVIPAAGYVALLLSTALGGPSVDSPYLPLPAGGGHGAAGPTSPAAGTGDASPTPARRAGADPARTGDGSTAASGAATATAPAQRPPATSAPATGTQVGTTPAPTASPTASHGKSVTTHPTPTHTGHGRG